jgi:hypothetical protein
MGKYPGSLHSNVLDCKQTTVELRTFVGDVTGEICTKWNERESTWRKSGSCQSRGTSQSRHASYETAPDPINPYSSIQAREVVSHAECLVLTVLG